MLYFDTSFLVPLVMPEASSEAVASFILGRSDDDLATSHWTRVEFASMIGRDVRMRSLDGPTATAIAAKFEAKLGETFSIVAPVAQDFERARQYLARPELGLRAGDALHLAVAANRECSAIYTLDRTMHKVGISLGLPTSFGIAVD